MAVLAYLREQTASLHFILTQCFLDTIMHHPNVSDSMDRRRLKASALAPSFAHLGFLRVGLANWWASPVACQLSWVSNGHDASHEALTSHLQVPSYPV